MTNRGVADITGCLAKVVSVERLGSVIDPSQDQQVPGFKPGWLSWVPAQFQPITIKPEKPVMLDLLLKLPNHPLRVALSPKLGAIRQMELIGTTTDCLALPDPGRYLIRVSIESTELHPLEKCYTFRWDGGHENFSVEEVPSGRPLAPRQAPRPVPSSEASRRGTVTLIIPTDVESLEAVLKTIIERTGSRSDERLHLFAVQRRGIEDAADTFRVAMWLNHPDEIVGKVNLPVVGTVSNLMGADSDASDEPEVRPLETVAFELTRREEVLDAITCKLLKLDAVRTEALLTFSHPAARVHQGADQGDPETLPQHGDRKRRYRARRDRVGEEVGESGSICLRPADFSRASP